MSHTHASFLQSLEPHHQRHLIFDLGNGQRVPGGYHVTEFKALQYHTVDCGNMTHQYNETVVELWRTKLEGKTDFMGVEKFLSIYDKVSPQVVFSPEAQLIVLYGAPGEPAARYAVGALEAVGAELIVHLEPDGVRCKSVERKLDAALETLPVATCCSASETATSSKLCC